MAIEFHKKTAVLQDSIGVDAAEGLLAWLQKHPRGQVDLAACTHLHTANLQVLLAAQPAICGWPQDPQLCAWLQSCLHPRASSLKTH